ncbi:thioesterase family protein [Phycicoccus sp. M110.8]|uniref:acyl-CoA thioesterase n=1 Tax=Phycicoccus sp. M110.8 TaxID=3075433 RepID=UPI0028FD45A8|nr:thioesterase family protein [Phycicoccus sp. M110.8]MDU0315219.1 thioesterase family protein [Phycicoccus sp. M110.8]HET8765728.1 thioesterase family protein [Pedococcus sp.]
MSTTDRTDPTIAARETGASAAGATDAGAADPFVHRVEVHFYEVDQVGVVFNAWYLAWCDDARLAYCDARGYGIEEAKAHDAMPLVRHAEIEWLASLSAGDHAEIVVRPVRVGTTSFTLRHEIHRAGDGQLCAVLTITYVAAGLAERTKRDLPLPLRRALEQDRSQRPS